MSAVYSPTPAAGKFPEYYNTPRNNGTLPLRPGAPPRKRVPVSGSAMQDGMSTGMMVHGLPMPAQEDAMSTWQTQDFSTAASATSPLQSQTEQRGAGGDRPHYLSPNRNEPHDQPSTSPSPSPNSRPSQLDTLIRQNTKLYHELEELRAERDQTQTACDGMLTELMTTQEILQERETELHSLREQLSHHPHQHGATQDGSPLSRSEQKELRELRLRCNRLQGECRRKDEQIQQAQTQPIMHQSVYGQPASSAQYHRELSDTQRRAMDAESRANQATQLHQAAQSQADAYARQMHEWSVAYDDLKASYNDLQKSHKHLRQTSVVEETRSREEAESKAALDNVKKMRDFFQQNSQTVAKKNIEIAEQLRTVQDALYAKTKEFEQQRGILEALQVQAQ